MTRFPKSMAKKEAEHSAERTLRADQRSRENERYEGHKKEASQGIVEPARDEHHTAANHQQSFGDNTNITWGRVVFSSPLTHWYKVLLDGGGSLPCTALMELSGQPFGVRSTSPIAPPANVLVWRRENDIYGVILGVIPNKTLDGSGIFPDWISQGSNGGFRREGYYKGFKTAFAKDGGQIDFMNRRPVDSNATGEWGRINDLGGGIFLDAFMAFMRMDEACGMWMFYMDRLLRICGHNMDLRTSISEQIVRNDNGEGLHFSGYTAYPWEALGAFAPHTEICRETENNDVHYNIPYGKCEPKYNDQQPFYRLEEFRGYLGQAYMRQLMLPPAVPVSVNNYANKDTRPGVFREQLSLDGSWSVESAHSIHITKRLVIPIPKRIMSPEDPKGDDNTNEDYKFAGVYGDGDEHKIQDGPAADGEEIPHVLTAAGLLDSLAYTFNWKGLHPFHYHTKDFYTPEASEVAGGTLQFKPDYASLGNNQWLPKPQEQPMKVDSRYGEAMYYKTQAGISILSDGSVVIRDGYGSEIRMSGGSIQMSAAGDIWQQAGRNVNSYAGDDVIVKARNSVDITATNHDVRLKAERHLEGLAGNGGQVGRILFDCQSSGPAHRVADKEGEDVQQSGVILKASKSEVIGLGRTIYLRTGGGGVSGGPITIDANKGKSSLQLVGSDVSMHTAQGLKVSTGVTSKKKVYDFGPFSAYMQNGVVLDGGLIVRKNGIIVSGNIGGINCQIYSDRNEKGLGTHDQSKDSWQEINTALQEVGTTFETLLKGQQDVYDQGIDEFWYADERPGNDSVIENTLFAPRNDEQLGTEDFALPENYWQQLRGDESGTAWTEKPIKYQGQEMMPHPGKKKWSDDEAFYKAALQLYDVTNGTDKPRGADYEDPTDLQWTKSKLDGIYPVTVS